MDYLLQMKKPKQIPFDFVIEKLGSLSPTVKPMFGCHAIYRNEKMLLILRRKETHDPDNGVWIATTPEHHSALKKDFPSMRSIQLFGNKVSSWQNLPEGSDDFEESAFRACDMILKGDNRIGKIPKAKKRK
jgi:hypothetical protein